MTIDKKLVVYDSLSIFKGDKGINNTSLELTEQLLKNCNSQIPYRSIVFIKDTGLIWTHGKYFNCSILSLDLNSKFVTLETSLTISGAKTFSQAINADILGNATTADRLKNNCIIELSGFVSGSADFNGGSINITTTSNSSVSGDGSSTDDWGKYITVKINGTSKTLKIPAKPKFSDLQEHPTTLDGYGITDAIKKDADIHLLPVHTKISTSWPTGTTSNDILKPTEHSTTSGHTAPEALWKLSGTNGLLKDTGSGSYVILITHSTDADGGVYTGYFSYTTGSGTDDEIILHRSGNDITKTHGGILYAKIKYIETIKDTYLMLASSKEELDCTELTIKIKKLL